MADEKKKAAKPLTAVDVVVRARGCGRAEAVALIGSFSLDPDQLVKAYADGANAVNKIIDDAADKLNPALAQSQAKAK